MLKKTSLKTPLKPCPMAKDRLARRDALRTELRNKYDIDMRYDSRLCLNYINNLGKVLTIEEIANEMRLMDHLYRKTSYSSMMGTLLRAHWEFCDSHPSKDRYQVSDCFSVYCKKLISSKTENKLSICSATYCCYDALDDLQKDLIEIGKQC